MIEGCTCISEIEKEKAERTGWIKLYEFPVGEDEYGNPCPIHAPEEKTMTQQNEFEEAQKERGEQLRALVVSWAEDKTFLLALNEQQRAIEEGKFSLNPEWGMVADEILGGYMSRQRMTAWDDKEVESPPQQPDRDSGPRIVIP